MCKCACRHSIFTDVRFFVFCFLFFVNYCVCVCADSCALLYVRDWGVGFANCVLSFWLSQLVELLLSPSNAPRFDLLRTLIESISTAGMSDFVCSCSAFAVAIPVILVFFCFFFWLLFFCFFLLRAFI